MANEIEIKNFDNLISKVEANILEDVGGKFFMSLNSPDVRNVEHLRRFVDKNADIFNPVNQMEEFKFLELGELENEIQRSSQIKPIEEIKEPLEFAKPREIEPVEYVEK